MALHRRRTPVRVAASCPTSDYAGQRYGYLGLRELPPDWSKVTLASGSLRWPGEGCADLPELTLVQSKVTLVCRSRRWPRVRLRRPAGAYGVPEKVALACRSLLWPRVRLRWSA